MPVSNKREISPYWQSECGRAVVYVGDCRTVVPALAKSRFHHAVVTDPPYELKFMNRGWDGTGVAYDQATWEAALLASLPGAHLLSFGGTRTWHRMVCAIEDAGWEIRDAIMWVYGSGFPKSRDVSKAVDGELGATRDQVRTPMGPTGNKYAKGLGDDRPWMQDAAENGYHEHDSGIPATDEAKQWQGWGTALKPAWEPIVLARKPLGGTVARCALENGTGALNVDACRIPTTDGYVDNAVTQGLNTARTSYEHRKERRTFEPNSSGRWPANLIHDGSDEVVSLFPITGGDKRGDRPHGRRSGGFADVGADSGSGGPNGPTYIDSGSASRFFYTAKASESDRPHGRGATTHPTVKPLDLMRYLVRLVCAPGGWVLDPFMGSGSTGCAAILEGMRFTGVEQSREYADIAVGKLNLALSERVPGDAPSSPVGSAGRGRGTVPPPGKLRGR